MNGIIFPLLFGALSSVDGASAPMPQAWRLPGAPTLEISGTLSVMPDRVSPLQGPGLLTLRTTIAQSRRRQAPPATTTTATTPPTPVAGTTATGASPGTGDQAPAAGTTTTGSTPANAQVAAVTGSAAPVADPPVDATATAPAADPAVDPNAAAVDPNAAVDPAAAAAAEEPDLELVEHRHRVIGLHRPLGIATWGTLLATEILGTITSINQPTWFGRGECRAGGSPILGFDYGCGGITTLHGVFAFATVSLYASTGIYALSMPDPERASEGDSRGATRLRIHKGLAWVHAIGMIIMPVLGFVGANTAVFGINDVPNAMGRRPISEAFRSVHEIVGFVTFGALTGAMITELLP